ncbi:MAG: MarR family winged helix-turn-helix transcriptional regulator [Candidatus Cyclobacteriaceae bacterium M2_1C_046]
MRLEDEIKQPKFKSERQKALVNLIYTYNQMISKMNDYFKEYDLTRQQYNVLRILRGQNKNPVTVNLIKERMLDKMSDASRIIQRLKTKGLVECQQDVEDRRALAVVISKKGLELLETIEKETNAFEGITQNLSEEEAKMLNDLLDKIRS